MQANTLRVTLIRGDALPVGRGACTVCKRREVDVRPALRIGEVIGDLRAGVPWVAICGDCWRACEGLERLADGAALALTVAEPGEVLPPYRA